MAQDKEANGLLSDLFADNCVPCPIQYDNDSRLSEYKVKGQSYLGANDALSFVLTYCMYL